MRQRLRARLAPPHSRQRLVDRAAVAQCDHPGGDGGGPLPAGPAVEIDPFARVQPLADGGGRLLELLGRQAAIVDELDPALGDPRLLERRGQRRPHLVRVLGVRDEVEHTGHALASEARHVGGVEGVGTHQEALGDLRIAEALEPVGHSVGDDMWMTDFAEALADAGGVHAPRERVGQLRALLDAELARSGRELALARSGYGRPLTVAIGADAGRLIALAPVSAQLRADPDAVGERAWLLTAALVGALVEAGGSADDLLAGGRDEVLALSTAGDDPELAALAFDEQARAVDRLRVRALAVPGAVVSDAGPFRPPIGAAHPLLVAAHVAALGGQPADEASVAEHEDAVLARLEPGAATAVRPHDDPDPARRIARRMLLRLRGMGKWGGYHTEFAHLSRGFAGNDRALADDVGERLVAAGLLAEKPSVGQRHVFLDPRRAPEIHALVDRGELPAGLVLPPARSGRLGP